MNVVSLFNGHGGASMALELANIKVDNMYVSEIDKFANKAYFACFPSSIQLGDVAEIDGVKFKNISLLCAGSPCQSFSFAGKRNGMTTKCEIEILLLDQYLELKSQGFEFEGQSYLFWEFVRLLNEIKPKYFFLENVFMSEKWENIITRTLGVKPIKINSSLVSAQNRKRNYWTNIGLESSGLFGFKESIIQQPKDRCVLLKDILENEVDEKYYIKNPKFGFDGMDISGKGNAMRVGGRASQSNKHNFDIVKVDKNLVPKPNQDKASCFTAGGHSGGNHSDMDLICVSMVGRKLGENGIRKDNSDIKAVQNLEPNLNGKTNCLTSAQKDNMVVQLNERQKNNLKNGDEKANAFLSTTSYKGSQANGMTLVKACDYRSDEGFRFRDNGKSGTLTARARNDESCGQLASINSRIRRLTPRECGRLQTVPENHIDTMLNCGVSDSQIYKMLGNGWNIETIAIFFKHIKP